MSRGTEDGGVISVVKIKIGPVLSTNLIHSSSRRTILVVSTIFILTDTLSTSVDRRVGSKNRGPIYSSDVNVKLLEIISLSVLS